MARFKLIIFDFDGTLGDSQSLIVGTVQKTIAELHLQQRTDAQCASIIGLPLNEAFKSLLGIDNVLAQSCTDTYRRIFERDNVPGAVKAFPHVLETVSALADMGITMTMASSRNRNSLIRLADDLGLSHYIQYLLGADDTPRAKPDPMPVITTLEALGFTPNETLMVGDAKYDILMGARANVTTCGVSYGNGTVEELKEAKADYIIDDFAQLLQIAKG